MWNAKLLKRAHVALIYVCVMYFNKNKKIRNRDLNHSLVAHNINPYKLFVFLTIIFCSIIPGSSQIDSTKNNLNPILSTTISWIIARRSFVEFVASNTATSPPSFNHLHTSSSAWIAHVVLIIIASSLSGRKNSWLL